MTSTTDRFETENSVEVERCAVSDVHGHRDELVSCLRLHRITSDSGMWAAGNAELWFLGDYLDRGNDGLGVIDLVRSMQREASSAGGVVHPLLGNHELQFLAARHFGEEAMSGGSTTFLATWRRYGGRDEELEAVTDDQIEWMSSLPLMGVSGSDVLFHSDTDCYLELGSTVEEINAAGRAILSSRDTADWANLVRIMATRGGLLPGTPRLRMLSSLGAERIIHGHNTLMGGFGLPPEVATQPYSYGDETVLAIDGGVFEDGGKLLLARL